MKKIYLFSYIKESDYNGYGKRKEKHLVLFYPYKGIDSESKDIYNQLRTYFQRNILPDKIIVICAEFNMAEVLTLFNNGSELYDYIPLFTLDSGFNNISINSLQKDGNILKIRGFDISEEYLSEIFNRGMVKIFNENGGLIVSQSAHHFVFPSGKHSDRFLRSGNVLIKGTQIQFIAFAVYRHFKGKKFTSIYCDTSSINSLAYAFTSLTKEFDTSFNSSVHVESFGSYQGFESSKFEAPKESLFMISSSTSGSIIKRMLEDKKRIIQEENICIIYALDVEDVYSNRIVCDLGKNEETNPEGLEPIETYNVIKGNVCKFCEDNSKPVEVKGDVFLLEKPVINGLLISTLDNSQNLKNFSGYFIKGPKNESIIKCYYKENSLDEKKYEIYIDLEAIFREWSNRSADHPFERIFSKLEKYIVQNIPASLKYIIVLPDTSSVSLANIIVDILTKQGLHFERKNILSVKEIAKIDNNEKGALIVVSSSVATGRNLLFISRALRDYEDNYQRIFFTFISRTSSKNHFDFLESNLSLGEFGKGTHKIVNVEYILCPHESFETPWHVEKDFLKRLEEFCEKEDISPKTMEYCLNRVEQLNESGRTNGLVNDLFFASMNGTPLKIRKGFAFAPNQINFISTATQSDIYFIISTILNDLRSRSRLDQSEYVRNLLEPGNFVRFNDGIIQAAILRAAKNDELRYDLSEEMSLQMQAVLEDMINHFEDEHSEAILEFFYAIAIKKLRLTNNSLNICIALLEAKKLFISDSIFWGLIAYIKSNILSNDRVRIPLFPVIE
jgi:hypothetical protein